MAFGLIKRIQEDGPDQYSGVLWDLDTWKEFDFTAQRGLGEVNRLDLVSYETLEGQATSLKLVASVRITQFLQQPVEVQDAVKALLRVVAKQSNPIDIIVKKF